MVCKKCEDNVKIKKRQKKKRRKISQYTNIYTNIMKTNHTAKRKVISEKKKTHMLYTIKIYNSIAYESNDVTCVLMQSWW